MQVFSRILPVFLLFFSALPVCIAHAQGPIASADEVNTLLKTALNEEQLAGVSWIMIDGENHISSAVGSANLSSNTPLTAQHRVHVGSVAKALIALGILRLVTEGKLDLDAPVESVLPEVRFNYPGHINPPVRVRHLLDHTAGLKDGRVSHFFSLRTTPDQPLQHALKGNSSLLDIRTQPGEHFSYSNVGFIIAAMVLERVTGERYETWLQRELLTPLQMHDSYSDFRTQHEDQQLAWGHLGDKTPAIALPISARPAGQFTTTPEDMAKLARFMMSNGQLNSEIFIREDLLREMGDARSTVAAKNGLDVGYTLGLARRDRDGHVGLCHSGDVLGYHAMFCLYPEYQRAFFLAINNDVDDANYARFDTILTNALHLPKSVETTSKPIPSQLSQWQGRYRNLVSRFTLQEYTDLLDATARLNVFAEHAEWQRGSRPIQRLTGAGENLLKAEDRALPNLVAFKQNGIPHLSDGLRTYRMIPAWLPALLWIGFILGILGLLLLCAMPLLQSSNRWHQPIFISMLLLITAGIALYLQPFMSIGDLTIGSALLTAGTASLPITALWHAWRSRNKQGWQRIWEISAALSLLQWCVTLFMYNALPLNLWA